MAQRTSCNAALFWGDVSRQTYAGAETTGHRGCARHLHWYPVREAIQFVGGGVVGGGAVGELAAICAVSVTERPGKTVNSTNQTHVRTWGGAVGLGSDVVRP